MHIEKSLISKLSLDHPGLLLERSSSEQHYIYKYCRQLLRRIQNNLEDLRSQYPIDEKEIRAKIHSGFPGANAISIKNGSLKDKTSLAHMIKNKEDYLFCVKSDGTRYLWVICEDGKQYFVARNMQIFKSKVELPPFFFQKRRQELLIFQKRVQDLPMDKRFTTPKVKISKKGEYETVNHRIGRLDGLFQKNPEDKLIQAMVDTCLLYTSPSPRDLSTSRMPSSA